jgi:hypothetical protein
MSIIELMIAAGITVVAMSVALALVVFGTTKTRDSDLVADTNSYARIAGDAVANSLRIAGLGAGQGIYLNSGGAPFLVNAFWGGDNLTVNQAGNNVNLSDDLWVITTNGNAMLDNCNIPGGYQSVISPGLGALNVRPIAAPCTPSFANGDNLLASNLNNAALLTNIQVQGAGSSVINYAESTIPSFSNAPQKGGFQVGDMLYRAFLHHYYLDYDPTTSGLALYHSLGRIGADFLGRPLVDIPGTATIVQRYIDDLQIVYWTDPNITNDPTKYTDQHGLNPTYQVGVRSVTIYVISRSRSVLRDASGRPLLSNHYAAKSIANHSVWVAPDGLRRSIYSRRIEIPNLMASNL